MTPAKTRWMVVVKMDYIDVNKGTPNYSYCTVCGIFIVADWTFGIWLLVWGMHFLSVLSVKMIKRVHNVEKTVWRIH